MDDGYHGQSIKLTVRLGHTVDGRQARDLKPSNINIKMDYLTYFSKGLRFAIDTMEVSAR